MSRLIIWPSMMLLGWTETKLWTLKYGSKSIQTSLILRQRPLKPYKLLKFFMISVILFKMGKHSDFHLSFFQTVSAWRDFTVVTKLMKNFMWWCQFIDWLKFETRPSSLLNFGRALCHSKRFVSSSKFRAPVTTLYSRAAKLPSKTVALKNMLIATFCATSRGNNQCFVGDNFYLSQYHKS